MAVEWEHLQKLEWMRLNWCASGYLSSASEVSIVPANNKSCIKRKGNFNQVNFFHLVVEGNRNSQDYEWNQHFFNLIVLPAFLVLTSLLIYLRRYTKNGNTFLTLLLGCNGCVSVCSVGPRNADKQEELKKQNKKNS